MKEFKFTEEELKEIMSMIAKLPYFEAAPIIARINAIVKAKSEIKDENS